MSEKPRIRFCWECGRKLRGNHFAELEVDGYKKILHKECAERIKTNKREPDEDVMPCPYCGKINCKCPVANTDINGRFCYGP